MIEVVAEQGHPAHVGAAPGHHAVADVHLVREVEPVAGAAPISGSLDNVGGDGRAEARPGRSSALVVIVPGGIGDLADAHEAARVGAGERDVAAVVELAERAVAQRLRAVGRPAAHGREVALLHRLAEADSSLVS